MWTFFWYLALSLRLCLTLLVFLERADRSCVWVFLSCWTERGKMWNKKEFLVLGFLLQVNSGLPKHQVMYVPGWPKVSLALSLTLVSHLAANVIALELVAGCWLNGISGIFARVYALEAGALDRIRVSCLWAHQSMRDQLYHFNSPECVRFLLILFSLRVNFWFFINDFFSSCNYFIFFAN